MSKTFKINLPSGKGNKETKQEAVDKKILPSKELTSEKEVKPIDKPALKNDKEQEAPKKKARIMKPISTEQPSLESAAEQVQQTQEILAPKELPKQDEALPPVQAPVVEAKPQHVVNQTQSFIPQSNSPNAPRSAQATTVAPRSLDSPAPRTFTPAPRKELKLKKPQEVRSFDGRDKYGLRDSDNEAWRKKRAFKHGKKGFHAQEEIIRPKTLKVRIPITVKDLAHEMKLKANQLITKLFTHGRMYNLNSFLDDETEVQLLGHELGCEITIDTSQEERIRITDKTIKDEINSSSDGNLIIRPPVVAFMGHVDHGKTSLIDCIRKSNRAANEAGAITQHIGAFRVKTQAGEVTILDTPGHEAFSEMRARGANVTDIVILVVAGDEGIRAQTVEAIRQAKEANVPVVVAINKCDKPNFQVEQVYRGLSENELLPEAWGGSVITVNCSATTGEGVKELLEMIALQAEVLELKANPQARARGTVLESEMELGLGAVATVLVQNGTLKKNDAIVFGSHYGRIRTMQDEFGSTLDTAGPGVPVKVTGLSGTGVAGFEFVVVKSEKEAKELAEERADGEKRVAIAQSKMSSLDKMMAMKSSSERKTLSIILRADKQGSLEAVKSLLSKIEQKKVVLNIIHSGIGFITESDINLAADSGSTIVGFHTDQQNTASELNKSKKVPIILEDIIYHVVDKVKEGMKGLLEKIEEKRDLGKAEVKQIFTHSQLGTIAGCFVTEGIFRRTNNIRLVRAGKVIWEGRMKSLKRVKEDVREVKEGLECGILPDGTNDVQPGDRFESFEVVFIEQEL